jgi:hypothetical protein
MLCIVKSSLFPQCKSVFCTPKQSNQPACAVKAVCVVLEIAQLSVRICQGFQGSWELVHGGLREQGDFFTGLMGALLAGSCLKLISSGKMDLLLKSTK